jgi:hypothetical protein
LFSLDGSKFLTSKSKIRGGGGRGEGTKEGRGEGGERGEGTKEGGGEEEE